MLHSRLAAAVALWAACACPPLAEAAEAVDIELVLAVDVSDSIDADEARGRGISGRA